MPPGRCTKTKFRNASYYKQTQQNMHLAGELLPAWKGITHKVGPWESLPMPSYAFLQPLYRRLQIQIQLQKKYADKNAFGY